MSRMQADPSVRTGYLAWQVTHVMGARLERALRSLDLTTAQHNALQHLVWTPGISAAEIARRTGFTPQSMGTAVNALVDRGLLVRREHPSNRRTVRLSVTDKGVELAERARDLVERLDREALAVLAPAERSAVHSLLYRMLAELNPAALPPMDPRDANSGTDPIPPDSAVEPR
ncbi:MarR family winged helix-turn-helix transcriptional regulator [Streptomyces coeruleorubidus]|uniref:MarR family winged helix-turn-helix transcriptional regulator n=1 Tax=Streptomyces coeruleorubidus TaxID=116188 RepID=UPI003700F4FC